jgi:hypothetical protein
MGVIGRLNKNGDLLIAGEVNERLPAVTDGLIAYFPFDGTLNKKKVSITGAKVLGYHGGTSRHPWYDYFNTNAILTHTDDILSISVDIAKQYDLIVVDRYVWDISSVIINKLKEFVDAGISCVAMGNDTRTNVFVKSYNTTAHTTHDIYIESDIPIKVESYVYTCGSGDLYGGITELQNGAYPYYRRADTNEITGYIYESPQSGAIFYFDQEGLTVQPFIEKAFLYALERSSGGITYSNVSWFNDSIAIESGTSNYITISNMESYEIGYTGNVCGFTNNFDSRFGAGNWKTEIIPASYSPVPGLTKCQRIETYSSGWGGWISGNIGPTTGNIVYGVWIRLFYGEIQWGDLNTTSRLYITTDVSKKTDPKYDVIEPGKWVYVARTFPATSSGRHLYANGPTKADILAVQIEDKMYPTSYVNGSRSNALFALPSTLLNINNGAIVVDFYWEGVKYSNPSNPWMMITHSYTSAGYEYNKINIAIYGNANKLCCRLANNTPSTWVSNGFDLSLLTKGWNRYIVTWDKVNGKLKECLNGNITVEQTPTYFPDLAPEYFYIGSWGTSGLWANMRFKNLIIYNKYLSDEEISKLCRSQHSFTTVGNLIVQSYLERPIGISEDIFYFPLGNDTRDEYKFIKPVSESNVVYENNAVWLGTSVANQVSNPDGKSVNLTYLPPGTYKPGWNTSLHNDAIVINNWSTGYNSGVPSPDVGYHAKWVFEGIDGANDPCMKFIDLNSQFGLTHRWLGIAQTLGTPSSLGWSVGTTITISWYQKSSVLNKGARVGIYHKCLDTGSYSFETCIQTLYVSRTNIWEKVGFTYTITDNWDLSASCLIYVYGHYGDEGILWVDNVQVEQRNFITPFVSGTRGISDLEFNLYSSVGLDWNGDWSIIYWKKPVGTHTGNTLTGYNIESIGCNSNSVGGGYRWWGKDSGYDRFRVSGMVLSTFSPSDYFNKWQMVSIVKNGTTVTWKFWISTGVITYSETWGTIASNYFVTQYGYDLKLGGWDNSNVCNTYFRDLIVVKKALSNDELSALYRCFMRIQSNKLYVQNNVKECFVF